MSAPHKQNKGVIVTYTQHGVTVNCRDCGINGHVRVRDGVASTRVTSCEYVNDATAREAHQLIAGVAS